MNQETVNPYNNNPYDLPPANANNTNMLIWSIVNIIFCNQILGIIALVFTLKAQNPKTNTEWVQNNKIAKILNIIATSLGGIVIIGVIAYILIVFVFAIGISLSDLSFHLQFFIK